MRLRARWVAGRLQPNLLQPSMACCGAAVAVQGAAGSRHQQLLQQHALMDAWYHRLCRTSRHSCVLQAYSSCCLSAVPAHAFSCCTRVVIIPVAACAVKATAASAAAAAAASAAHSIAATASSLFGWFWILLKVFGSCCLLCCS